MSYFDDASLVMIPSGYKTSKVYSVKPTDGSGDLTFSRSNDTATRVNSAGLIEKVRTNLYPRGSALLATGWTSIGATLTAGQTDPNGGTTALRVQLAAGGSPYSYILQSFTGSAATYARSAYIKAASAQSIRIVDPHSGAGTTVNLTTNWQRFTAVGAGSGGNFGIQFDNNNDAAAKDFTIAFVQIEEGDIATDYIATTSAAVSVGPVANVPRLDYLGSTCGKLILEPQRTNLATYSEQAVQYSQLGATIGSNVATSPDGYTNADSIIEDGSNNNHVFYNFGLTTFTAAAYTASVFAKKGSRDWCALQIYDGTQGFTAFFNLNTGVAGTISGVGTSTITNCGNGWYRCTITATTLAGSTGGIAVYSTTANGSTSYVGTNGLTAGYFYGWQLELGAYATSYIPTLGAAVTRGADAMTLSALNNTDMTFTAFLELDEPSIGGTASDWFMIKNAATLGRAFGYGNVFGFADAYSTSALSKTKMLWKQESGTTAKIFGDGALLGTSTTGTYSTPFTILEFYGTYLLKPVRIKQFIFFANNITDAQCIELTTL